MSTDPDDLQISGGGPEGTTSASQQEIAREGSGGEKDPAEDD